jgi:hypothetical protein
MIRQPTIDGEVTSAVTNLFREEMGRYGFRGVRIMPSEDHDGDPILLIEADYTTDGEPIDTAVMMQLISKLRDLLWAKGELRFPHIQHNFEDHQRVVGFK